MQAFSTVRSPPYTCLLPSILPIDMLANDVCHYAPIAVYRRHLVRRHPASRRMCGAIRRVSTANGTVFGARRYLGSGYDDAVTAYRVVTAVCGAPRRQYRRAQTKFAGRTADASYARRARVSVIETDCLWQTATQRRRLSCCCCC